MRFAGSDWSVAISRYMELSEQPRLARENRSSLGGRCSVGAVALMDRETRSTGVGVGSLVRSRRRVHRKLPPDVGADVGLRLRARNDRVADSG